MILNKFKKTEITSSIFLVYSSMKLESNYKKKTSKDTNVETEQHIIEQSMDQWRNQRGNKKNTLRQMKIQFSKIYSMQGKQFYEGSSQW